MQKIKTNTSKLGLQKQLKSTTVKRGVKSNTRSNAKKTHKENSGKIKAEIIQVEGTPFVIAASEEGYRLVFGKYQISPTLKTKKEVEEYWKRNEWNIIVNVLHVMLEFHGLLNHKKEVEEENKMLTDKKQLRDNSLTTLKALTGEKTE